MGSVKELKTKTDPFFNELTKKKEKETGLTKQDIKGAAVSLACFAILTAGIAFGAYLQFPPPLKTVVPIIVSYLSAPTATFSFIELKKGGHETLFF